MSIDTYLIEYYISLGVSRKFARKPNMLRPEHVLPLCPISTLFRACMSLVNLHASCIVSHHLFTIIYRIRVTNFINIAQTILKSQYRIFNNRQICRQHRGIDVQESDSCCSGGVWEDNGMCSALQVCKCVYGLYGFFCSVRCKVGRKCDPNLARGNVSFLCN
jgi:hypothetical protein